MYYIFLGIIFLLFSCASLEKSVDPNKPQLISLTKELKPSLTHKYVYDEVVMKGPNFNVFQSHEGLKKHFSLYNDRSMLCGPSALATALIQEKLTNPKSKTLPLAGFSEDGKTVDANKLIHQLVDCSAVDASYGTRIENSASCIKKMYTSVHLNVDIQIISTQKIRELSEDVRLDKRKPSPEDIIYFLKNDYLIIGHIDSVFPDSGGAWSISSGHIIYLHGYARQNHWDKDLLFVYFNDPWYFYQERHYPVSDQALVTKISHAKNLPNTVGEYSFEGSTHYGLSTRGVLSSLLVFKVR